MSRIKFIFFLTCLLIAGCCSDRKNPLLSNRDYGIHYYSSYKYYPDPQYAYREITKEKLGELQAFYKITYNMDTLPETVEKWLNNKVVWKEEFFYENGRLVKYRTTSDQKVFEKEIKYRGCRVSY